jgi:hypothetical protein
VVHPAFRRTLDAFLAEDHQHGPNSHGDCSTCRSPRLTRDAQCGLFRKSSESRRPYALSDTVESPRDHDIPVGADRLVERNLPVIECQGRKSQEDRSEECSAAHGGDVGCADVRAGRRVGVIR